MRCSSQPASILCHDLLAMFGRMALVDASAAAQLLAVASRQQMTTAGFLRERPGGTLVSWTSAGRAACMDAARADRRYRGRYHLCHSLMSGTVMDVVTDPAPAGVPASPRLRFEALWAAQYSVVVSWAARRLPAADAADVVAETFLVAWRRLDDIPLGFERAWLLATARRVSANLRRGQRRRVAAYAQLIVPDLTSMQVTAPSAETSSAEVLAALAKLSHRDQEVLRLVAWEELSLPELAMVLGCRPNTAAARLSRARRRLRHVLARLLDASTDLVPVEDPVTKDSATEDSPVPPVIDSNLRTSTSLEESS